MAILEFDGTKSGSGSGWTRRFFTEGVSSDFHSYRIEIIDTGDSAGTFSQSETTVTRFRMEGDTGFRLEYDGDTDNRHTPLVPSTLQIAVLVDEDAIEELVTALQTSPDNRFGLAMYIHEPDNNSGDGVGSVGSMAFADASGWWRPVWFGTILSDQTESVLQSNGDFFEITANCGLVLLNDEPFIKDDGTRFTDIQPLSRQIGRCLAKLPTASLWGWNQYNGATEVFRDYNQTHVERTLSETPVTPFFRECVWILDKEKHAIDFTVGETTIDFHGGASVLDLTKCDSNAFVEVEEEEDNLGGIVRARKFTSCSEVLENIASCLGARIFLSDGSWWFQNPDSMIATTRREFVWFDQYQLKAVNATNQTASPLTNSTAGKPIDVFDQGFEPDGKTKVTCLFPTRLVESVHDDGGARLLATFSQQNYGYDGEELLGTNIIYFEKHPTLTQWLCKPIVASHADVVIEGGESFAIVGNLQFSKIGKKNSFGPSTFNDLYSDNARGARFRVSMKIKCGDYYLKRQITTRSETVNIKNAVGSTTNTQKFEAQNGDVEWTLTDSDYQFTIPRMGSEPVPPVVTIEDSNGDQVDADFPGGFHTRLRSNGTEFKVVTGATLGDIDSESTFAMNWVLPPTPTGVTHTGIEITIDVRVMNSEHQLLSGTAVRDFFSEDSENQFQAFYNGTSALAIGTAFLKVLSGEASEDNPVSFIAEADKNTSRIVTAKSIFGDKYTVGATTRALTLVDADDASTSYADGNWVTLDNLTANGKYLHQLLADETLQKRHNPLEIRKGKHAYTAQTPPPLSDDRGFYDIDKIAMSQFQRPIKFAYTNGTTLTFEFLNLLVAKDRTAYVISRCKTSRDLTSITNWDTTDEVRGPQTTSGGNGNPGSTGPGPVAGFEIGVASGSNTQGDIAGLRRSQAGTTSDVTAIEDKTRFITASGTGITNITGDGTCLRASNILENPNQKFVTQSEKDAIASNTLQALNNANDISTNAGNITTNATDITTNATDIATNVTDIATNATDITALETDMTAVENALDEANNGSSARTGQTGVEVATFNASGVLGSVDDGSRNQFLKTNGLGVLSFDSIEITLASLSARVTTTNSSGFYYGSSSFGFNYPIWSSINFNNTPGNPYALKVNDDYAHCGIMLPFKVSALRVIGSVRNDSGTENVEVGLFYADSPDGDSAQMTLTEIDTTEVTVSVVDRHYDFEIDQTESLAKGKLLFLGFRRTSTTTGTRYVNFTATITGKRA